MLRLVHYKCIVSTKIYDKWDGFNLETYIFPFLDGGAPRSPSDGVYILQLIRFARVCSHVDDFNNRNKFLTSKLLKQGDRYHKLCKSKKEGKDQESIQSSTTLDPGYQWESDNVTIRHHKREARGQPFPSRWPQGIKLFF